MPFIPEDQSDVFDDRLKEVSTQCPDCGVLVYGTGRMEYNALTHRWYVEFWCPIDRQHLLTWNAAFDPVVQSVATDNGY